MRHSLLALTLLIGSLIAGRAADPSKANETLLHGTSPYEDMIGFALAKNEARLNKSVATADKNAASVKGALSPSAVSQFDALLIAIHRALDAKEPHAVAANAVEVFRLMIDNLQAESLKIPKEVSLLDYAGFKLRVLAAAEKHDWPAMRKIVVDASSWWGAIKSKVSDKRLRDAFNSTVRGLEEAGKTENLPMLHFAAQIDLDLVDLLESHFEGRK